MNIRRVSQDDAKFLVPLWEQLGYPSNEIALRDRFRRIENRADYAGWLAETIARQIRGFVGGHLLLPFESNEPVVLLTALVVDENARGLGVGRKLVNEIAEWARENGANRLSLTSAYRRESAYEFYRQIGFVASGTRFGMCLT